jgi:uracil-DNA glycosylase family 4
MMNNDQILDARSAASVMDWWKDAGVDVLVEDEPQPWIGRTARPVPIAAAPPEPEIPGALDALVQLLMKDETLEGAGPVNRRVAPFGKPGAALMILTDMPELTDADTGQLLSGELGALFDKMLGAIQLDRESVYCAALCPSRTPSGRIDDIALPRLAALARQHIHLAAPKRLWLLGQSTSRAILGAETTNIQGKLHLFNHKGSNVECVASLHPRLLLQNPRHKALVWEDMKLLVGGMSA